MLEETYRSTQTRKVYKTVPTIMSNRGRKEKQENEGNTEPLEDVRRREQQMGKMSH